MLTPPYAKNEESRISALRALQILDTDAEERFDRLTRLAKRLFDVPIALVSLVDTDRQWFKSRQGLDAFETPRDISFCGHSILGDRTFVVEDATQDERFHDNPLVAGEPNIRFYAGCPLTVNGHKMGTLCIIDRESREMVSEDQDLLMDLATMVEQELIAVQMATIDSLTDLSNKRGFETLGKHALSLCRRLGKSAALLFLDLDGFKPINDEFGHKEGDTALKGFSQVIKETFRDSDVYGRIGGDEFAVLVTSVGPRELLIPLERLRDNVRLHNQWANRGYDIEYSLGVTWFDADRHKDISDLMADADAVMYDQKRNGPEILATRKRLGNGDVEAA